MSDDYPAKISDLLPDHLEAIEAGVEQHLRDEPGALIRLSVGLVKNEAARQLQSVLHVDAFELIAKAWASARELHGYTNVADHPPGHVEITHLGEHTLTTGVHPVLRITIAGHKLEPMRFSLILTAKFQSAALSIRDGAIIAVAPGDASATAVLKYRDIDLHKPLPLKTLHLPVLKTFDPGLHIP